MVYFDFIIIIFGLYLFIFKDLFKLDNYYLGRYFNKTYGLFLIGFNLVSGILFLIYKIQTMFIFVPFLFTYLLTKEKETEFKYSLIRDNYYEKKEGKKPHRRTVRGIVINGKNEVGLVHLVYDDPLFEYRDHYELPGGGIDENEAPIKALKREIEEELGYTIKDIHYLCQIGIEYNPFNRIDDSDIFVCKVDKKTDTNFQGLEKEFIKEIKFIKINELLKIYKENNQEKVGKQIYKRDEKLLKLYKSCN